MPDLADGETFEMKGSAARPYVLKNTGGVYSCSCPAWRNQSVAIERRTCKHLRKLRGDKAEEERVGGALPQKARPAKLGAEGEEEGGGPPLLLAQTWTNDADLSGWWMSEKLDGVRAYWDGKQFISRQGNLYHAPDWFGEILPNMPLDGELWLDRKAFQRTVSIVRRQDKSEHWREISFLVFDAPALDAPFEERMAALREALTGVKAKHVRLHAHEQCRGVEHLREELARIEALGGEGLMLREPGSKYQIGRSTTLLKVKTFHDAEARVIDHQPGAGRHKGRLGALLVELADGTQFSVGTGFSDGQRANPPAIGSTITFRYQELSDRGVPRFPSFVRAALAAAASAPSAAEAAPPAATQRRTAARESSAPSPSVPSKESSTMKRYFEYTDEKSNKFWEIDMSGTSVTVRFGKIGANGQTQTKTFPDAAAAQKHHDKLVEEKTEKGYEEKSAP
jgi:DNA ligase-1